MIEHYDPAKGQMFQILSEAGDMHRELDPGLSDSELRKIYSLMVATRVADLKALKLQRQGRLGTFAPSLGHEACQVGSAFALRKEDWVFPYFRDLGTYLTLGLPLTHYFLYWMGNEEGMRIPEGLNIFTISVPVGSHLPHAVGCAMALKMGRRQAAAVAYFGDGATSEGDFHEALNFAGVFRTPNVFICFNNQYAISTPVRRQTASANIALKAAAYGIGGILVDGNDALAMYAATREALENARSGNGPTLIEAMTYRMGNHTTSDDASRYRTDDEVEAWRKKDPIDRFKIFLQRKGLWDEAWESEIQRQAEDATTSAVAEAEKTPPPEPEDLFVHTFRELPPELREQLAELKSRTEGGNR